MSPNKPCIDIATLSAICGREGYQSQNSTYHDADRIVGRLSGVVVRSLGRSITRRPPARCKAAIRTLTCSVVFPQCPSRIATHYSELLHRVSSACSIGIDDLSDRLVAGLSQHTSEGEPRRWPARYDSGADSGVGDLAVCAAMCFVLWWFGVWLVRQWSRDMADAFSQLQQPLSPLATGSKEEIAIEVRG
ncbi:hypothetical protein IWW39_001373 [Coemansia spiralis]|uniref:Uncharacterized protein n=1 Tax=Coemansia spiralis TaxID=417178 RepID=A0A9W8GQC4_9FUNG|nr:hypothetical protein IWW39_001373 [Coemansia spiralis]